MINSRFAKLYDINTMPRGLFIEDKFSYAPVSVLKSETKEKKLHFKSDPEKDKKLDPFTKYLRSVAKEGEIKIVPEDKIKRLKDENKDPMPYIEIGPSLSSMNWKGKSEKSDNIEMFANLVTPPVNWKNFDDSPNAELKYRISTRPMNQQLCGSCYACAVATCISDTFIFDPTIQLKENPNISPMSILSCLNVNGCDGGDPFNVLKQINQNGVMSTYCLNYHGICGAKLSKPDPDEKVYYSIDSQGNVKYTGKAPDVVLPIEYGGENKGPRLDKKTDLGNNFYERKEVILKQTNNGISIGSRSGYGPIVNSCDKPIIPKCMCFSSTPNPECGTNKFNKFYVNLPQLLVVDEDPNAILKIKNHLLTYGSAISAFFIYNNFQDNSDDFADTRGIYIESESYGSSNPKGQVGAHAICIVGWGVEPQPITLKSNGLTLSNVEYWIVRNSWGTTWGEGGYFKMAMNKKVKMPNNKIYEINPTTSLEKYNTIGDIEYLGGVIVFTPRKTIPYDGNCQVNSLRENRSYHAKEKLINVSTNETSNITSRNSRTQILQSVRGTVAPKVGNQSKMIILLSIAILAILYIKTIKQTK
jgi:hypothetical protein